MSEHTDTNLTAQTIRDALAAMKTRKPPTAIQYLMNEHEFAVIYCGMDRLHSINAKLLAALEAGLVGVETLMDDEDVGYVLTQWRDQAREAIREAKGES
jgi:hypothetical protein